MKTPRAVIISTTGLLLSGIAFAEDVSLPVPILEWSVYLLLIFALAVGIGIFFKKGKNKKDEFLGALLNDQDRIREGSKWNSVL